MALLQYKLTRPLLFADEDDEPFKNTTTNETNGIDAFERVEPTRRAKVPLPLNAMDRAARAGVSTMKCHSQDNIILQNVFQICNGRFFGWARSSTKISSSIVYAAGYLDVAVGGLLLVVIPVKIGVAAQAAPFGTNFHLLVGLPLESGAYSKTSSAHILQEFQ